MSDLCVTRSGNNVETDCTTLNTAPRLCLSNVMTNHPHPPPPPPPPRILVRFGPAQVDIGIPLPVPPVSSQGREGRKIMFYLTTHSTHFIYGYMASDIWLRTILIVRKETRCRHIGYSFRLTARVLFICTITQTG